MNHKTRYEETTTVVSILFDTNYGGGIRRD